MADAVVAGNWKMNLGPEEARAFVERFSVEPGLGVQVLLFPPDLSLCVLREAREAGGLEGVGLGVQNIHPEDSGAFTGETSAPMVRQAGAEFVLVGHSERRHVFGESDADTRRKVDAALRHDLIPVLCVGETLEERRGGRVADVILRQLEAVLAPEAMRERIGGGQRLLLAYEPVWAIGTGETATPVDASEAHGILRERLGERVGPERAEEIAILYGGSVKPGNAGELLAAPQVDGVLVGGASLDPHSFAEIVAAAG
jgi:triosephosphate isomerase (TIM)